MVVLLFTVATLRAEVDLIICSSVGGALSHLNRYGNVDGLSATVQDRLGEMEEEAVCNRRLCPWLVLVPDKAVA